MKQRALRLVWCLVVPFIVSLPGCPENPEEGDAVSPSPSDVCALRWSPESIDFLSTLIGTSTSVSVQLINSANSSCTLTSVAVQGQDPAVFDVVLEVSLPFVLKGNGGRIDIMVTFTPKWVGSCQGQVLVSGLESEAVLELSGQGATELTDQDSDGDGILDEADNCEEVPNPTQEDMDGDGIGDPCDVCPDDPGNDADEDEVCAETDNCEDAFNPGQDDSDGDGVGDACDPCPGDTVNDPDGDGVCEAIDNCDGVYNPTQMDSDGDGLGDACDPCPYDPENDLESECHGQNPSDPCANPPPVFSVGSTPGCDNDLELRVLATCPWDCDSDVEVVCEVFNHGTMESPPTVPMSVYGVAPDGAVTLLQTWALDPVPPGSTSGGFFVNLGSYATVFPYTTLSFALDDGVGGIPGLVECNEENNEAEVMVNAIACPTPAPCEVPPPRTPDSVEMNCGYQSPVAHFDPVVEWQKSSFILDPDYDHVVVMPAVGNLTDDNGDGRVDDSDIPDIVFTTFYGAGYELEGRLRALSGDDGHELWATAGAAGAAGVAIGDADGDGLPEIYSVNTLGRLVAYDRHGTRLWTCPTIASEYAYPAIGNVDGTGAAEILAGQSICDVSGQLVVSAKIPHGPLSYLFDVDMDGRMEIVSGAGISRTTDGSTIWRGPGGYSASANFDSDALPELVVAWDSEVYLFDDDGTVLWSINQGGVGGGPPTIADFDGDGEPEIGTANSESYKVFDGNGTILWSRKTQDWSSAVTGSSVFDFQGDGAAEAVYASELTLWVYGGMNGQVLLEESDHASGTLYEYPVIVDVDRDGEAEIVLASNDYYFSGWNGITVIGAALNHWVSTRAVWNQHAYHITNVNDDLSIPELEAPNWTEGNNSFRQGGFATPVITSAPDLTPHLVDACLDLCPQSIRVLFQVENHGLRYVSPGLPFAIYGEDASGRRALLQNGTISESIPPAWTSDTVEIILSDARVSAYAQLVLVVDDDGTGTGVEDECREDNNALTFQPGCGQAETGMLRMD